jgi:hypothetical protein
MVLNQGINPKNTTQNPWLIPACFIPKRSMAKLGKSLFFTSDITLKKWIQKQAKSIFFPPVNFQVYLDIFIYFYKQGWATKIKQFCECALECTNAQLFQFLIVNKNF